ncbi:hypothetical protein BDY24DRAFT_253931 [Mrakia frigida]|uniref:uncharacterized protein n=1 Tax=Mrakia frigida TaxID=29902 RepID=UPI003FCC18FE
MSNLPPSPPSKTVPIPISTTSSPTAGSSSSLHRRPSNSTSQHVRSLSFSFGSANAAPPPASTSPSSTYSPTTPSPILAEMNALAGAGTTKSSFFSTSPRPTFGKDWASSWSGAGGGGGGGGAVFEDDEDEGAMGLSKSLGGPAGSRVQGWAGSVIGSSSTAGGTASLLGSSTGTGGTRVVVQNEGGGAGGSQKINGVLRRLSLGGAGLSRPNFQQQPQQQQQQQAPTPLPTPVAATQSFFPPSATAVPDLIPDRPSAVPEIRLPRGRKASVGGKGKRGISPVSPVSNSVALFLAIVVRADCGLHFLLGRFLQTGERMLQGHHGGLF